MSWACAPELHRHQQQCARCGACDQTVAVTVTKDGRTWPPMCSDCAHVVRLKSSRIAAVARVEGLA